LLGGRLVRAGAEQRYAREPGQPAR
jgi:hypothetical protein